MSSAIQWTGHDHNHWRPSGATTEKLLPGIYMVIPSEGGPYLQQFTPKHDKAIIVEDGLSEHLYKSIEVFWDKAPVYKKLGLLHKRGMLLEGPPGTGKSMACMLLAERITHHGAAALIWNSQNELYWLTMMLKMLRQVQPNLHLLVLMEDLNAICDVNDVEPVLALLDGENQIDNVVYLATTNFLKELDERITNRPSRFDEVIKVGSPTRAARLSYLKQIIPSDMADDHIIQEMAKESEGLMMAHLRELMVSHLALGKPIKDVAARLKKMDADALSAAQERERREDAGLGNPTKRRRK